MTHADLESPGDLIAAAVKAVIAADSPAFPLPAYANRELAQMNVNRVEVTAVGFERASDQMGITSNAVPFYSHRAGSLAISVVTARTDQANTDSHRYAVGRIRYLLSRPAQKLTTTALSNLVCIEVEDRGESLSIDENTDLDRTTMQFSIEVFIPSAVYEAAT